MQAFEGVTPKELAYSCQPGLVAEMLNNWAEQTIVKHYLLDTIMS